MIKIKPDPRRPAVTEKLRKAVTKPAPASKRNGGRPKVHASNVDRQRAYRGRRHIKAGTGDYALTDKTVYLYEPSADFRERALRSKRSPAHG